VPGTEGDFVKIRDAVKIAAPKDIPLPGAFRKAGEEPKAQVTENVAAAEEETPVVEAAAEAAAPEAEAAPAEAAGAEATETEAPAADAPEAGDEA